MTNLPALLEDGGAGGGAALGGAQQPAGPQQPQAGGGEVAGGDLELAGVSPAQPCPGGSGGRQGVGLAKASAAERKNIGVRRWGVVVGSRCGPQPAERSRSILPPVGAPLPHFPG